jgi:4-amino-4-deoxy-L-arabinose transferase-like glycosyltransferase
MALPGRFSWREAPVKPALEARVGWSRLGYLLVLWALTIGLGLGTATRLTYHEAFVAQGAREIIASGHWCHPAIGSLPWLEKPPLPFWLVAALGWCAGEVTPTVARLPFAVSALGLALGVGLLSARRYGSAIGILAAAVQTTTAWTILRGRLAEADILLACLITWTLLAFDHLRALPVPDHRNQEPLRPLNGWQSWRWVFFSLLGITSLVKGTGFGAALVLSVVASVLLWDRDRATGRRLSFLTGWILVALLTLVWPLMMIAEHGFKVIELWMLHVTQRVGTPAGHGVFAGESWREYGLNVLGQALPWTPLAVLGARRSISCAFWGHGPNRAVISRTPGLLLNQFGGDRLLCCWAIAPLVLVSLTSARNAHYAIHAMIPWSIWSGLGLASLGDRLTVRGWSAARLRRLGIGTFTGLAAACGLGFWLAGPWLDRRGVEWAFYEATGRQLLSGESLALLYDDWDRDPYPTPFGAIPHDLAVRLYYLQRPVCWHFDTASLRSHEVGQCSHGTLDGNRTSVIVLGRERDLPGLKAIGRVEVISRSEGVRWDRKYLLARVWLSPESPQTALSSKPTDQVTK